MCKICDSTNFYRLLSSGKCLKWNVQNCEIPSIDPLKIACYLCLPGFYLDNRRNRCSPVPEKFLVPDCKRYGWEYSCHQCNDGFYLSQKKCKSLANPIQNCAIHTDPKFCLECNDGFFFQSSSESCEPLNQENKCLVYSFFECIKCTFGNFFLKDPLNQPNMLNEFLQSLTAYSVKATHSSAFYQSVPMNKCVKGILETCQKHETFNTCFKCKSGFFLTPDKQCVSYPVRTVSHCEAYSSANICSRCSIGYYLEKNVCRELNSVSGCLEFDLSTVDCLKCDQEKFYLDSGSCGARNKSINISYCAELNKSSDNCDLCLPSFQISDDKLKCLPHIPHCATYVSSTTITDSDYTNENTLILKCDTCDDYFYISQNNLECIPQDSPGCVTFTPNANTCITCASGYFLDNDQCTL